MRRIDAARPIATDGARVVVCLSVCWAHRRPLQKRLNRSRHSFVRAKQALELPVVVTPRVGSAAL